MSILFLDGNYEYYELDTPIITTIKPLKLNVVKGGSLKIKSVVPPNSSHEVQLNKASQIERSIIEIVELKNRVDELEKIYDTYLFENSLKLSLFSKDYELDMEDIDG